MSKLNLITRATDGEVISTSRKKLEVRAVFSTEHIDHYNTVFIQRGFDLSAFLANPILMFEHGGSSRGSLPIANARDVGIEKYKGKDALVGTAVFWRGDEFAEARFEDYAAKPARLRGWSQRSAPVAYGPPTREEIRSNPDWGGLENVFRTAKILEISAVSLPGNEHCLTLGVERTAGALSGNPKGLAAWLRTLSEADLMRVQAMMPRIRERLEREFAIRLAEWDRKKA